MNNLDEKLANVDNTEIFFTDLNGKLMNLSVNKEKITQFIDDGVGFDGSSIAGYASVENSDRVLMPDANSFKKIKFDKKNIGVFIGNVFNEEGQPASSDPRNLLQNILINAEKQYGYRFFAGPEYEYFLLNGDELGLARKQKLGEESYSDQAGYFYSTPHDKGDEIRNKVVDILMGCGIHYEKSHHEVTPSQHEINLEYTDVLSAADRSLLFKYITQKVAEENGYYVSFMPKPFIDYNRNAFHIHISLQDLQGNNLFYDKDADKNLHKTAKHFIGGILKYARETSIVMASTVNSYKAYVIEKEAPIVRGWGFRNRSSMVRVPFTANPAGTRIELRSPDPAGNVYMQMALLIAMGLQGISEELDYGIPDKGSTYERDYTFKIWDDRFLPRSFYEALVEAERSTFLKETLGEKLYNSYMDLKIKEWEEDRIYITRREQEKYLNV